LTLGTEAAIILRMGKKTLTVRSRTRVVGRVPEGGWRPNTGCQVHDLWVEQELEPGWIVAYRVLNDEGRPGVGEIRVFPDDRTLGYRGSRQPGEWEAGRRGDETLSPPGGVPATALRKIRLREVYAGLSEAVEDTASDPRFRFVFRDRMRFTETPKLKPRRPGRRGRGDTEYAKFAAAYVTILAEGNRAPIKELAARMHLGRESVRQLVHDARDRKLLTRTRSGRAGGELTDKARDLLGLPRSPRRRKKTER